MFKGRRVGTLTAGVVLIIFGLLFTARIIFPLLNYAAILQLWPVILVFLGIEVIVSYIINKEEKLKYDGGAIALVVILSFFAMGMAGAEYLINHLEEIRKL
jgi:uncharacterized membrane protein HdeD (DUF308 family)